MDIEFRQFSLKEVGFWLALHALSLRHGFPSATIRKLLDRFGDPKEIWLADRKDILSRDPENFAGCVDAFISKRKLVDPDSLIEEVAKTPDVHIYPIADTRYPFRLREIHDPPIVLFLRGQLFELDFNACVAVVGTRRPSSYGHKWAKSISIGLAENGVPVVSGLALGIDSYAHRAAIEGGGRTIAVLANGVDLCYPSSNRQLYHSILDGNGAVNSEFFPGTHPEKWHFPARNRIISGVAQGTVVIEAGEKSGALITARLASEQSRDVFALPGKVDSPTSLGTNYLIMQNRAKLIRDHKDVLDDLNLFKTHVRDVATVVELYGREKEIYGMLSNEPIHFDVLCEHSGMAAGELSATLTMLEIAGLVLRDAGDWYSLIDQSRRPTQGFGMPR